MLPYFYMGKWKKMKELLKIIVMSDVKLFPTQIAEPLSYGIVMLSREESCF